VTQSGGGATSVSASAASTNSAVAASDQPSASRQAPVTSVISATNRQTDRHTSAKSISLVSVDSTAEHHSHVFDVSCRICTGGAVAEVTGQNSATTGWSTEPKDATPVAAIDSGPQPVSRSPRSPRKKIGLAQRLKMYSSAAELSGKTNFMGSDVKNSGGKGISSLEETVGNEVHISLTPAEMADVGRNVVESKDSAFEMTEDRKTGELLRVNSSGPDRKNTSVFNSVPDGKIASEFQSWTQETLVELKNGKEQKLSRGSSLGVPEDHKESHQCHDDVTVKSPAEQLARDDVDDDDAVWKFPLLHQVGSAKNRTASRYVKSVSFLVVIDLVKLLFSFWLKSVEYR